METLNESLSSLYFVLYFRCPQQRNYFFVDPLVELKHSLTVSAANLEENFLIGRLQRLEGQIVLNLKFPLKPPPLQKMV